MLNPQKHCFGHPMPNSVVVLLKKQSKVSAEARIPMPDLQLILRDSIIQKYEALGFYISQHIKPKNLNGKLWKVKIEKLRFANSTDNMVGEYAELIVDFAIYPPSGKMPESFIFEYDVVSHQMITHEVDIFLAESNFNEALTKSNLVGKVELNTESSKIIVPIIKLDTIQNSIRPSKTIQSTIILLFLLSFFYLFFIIKLK